MFRHCDPVPVVSLPYCPSCGKEIEEGSTSCQYCGQNLSGEVRRRPRVEGGRGASGHISLGFNLALAKPMVFVPALLGGVISFIVERSGQTFVLGVFLSILGAIITFLLNFASLDLSRDALVGDPLDLGRSIDYVMSRIMTFLVAAVVGGLLSITVILIPVAILMFVIIVMDETDISNAISQAFGVLSYNLGDILVIFAFSIIGHIIIAFVPLGESLLSAFWDVIVGLALMDLYNQYRRGM